MISYVHEDLETEVRTISGHYRFTEEKRLSFRGREVVYKVGFAVIDNSCCGTGGCRFLVIPGYVVSWKNGKSDTGLSVSEVEPITSEEERAGIRETLEKEYPFSQIDFM
ncbi:MAG: hypothetical protein ACE14T_04845 [Syntrophales bacterium]